MGFGVTTRAAKAGDQSGTVYQLADAAGTARAEVWPFVGFNCLRWQLRTPDGRWGDALYAAPDWDQNPVPTRSGQPVLFPFPNRIQAGRFTFEGKTYQLPLNDSSKQNAIHGFTPRHPWRVLATGGDDQSAFVTGQFQLSKDLPSACDLWPADFALTLTYRLFADALRVEAVIENPDTRVLPFGLGYHPYFCIPTAPGAPADEFVLRDAANTLWETENDIPTGQRVPVPPQFDFRLPRPIGAETLDNLFTGLSPAYPPSGGLGVVATLRHLNAPGRLEVAISPEFRELVLFTPPHRKAIAIEPYTCATNAVNLELRGIGDGWRVLPAGGRLETAVEYRWRLNGL
jgi:aldose 1-epimerase